MIEGSDDRRAAGDAEKLVLRTDKDLDALGLFREGEHAEHRFLLFQDRKEVPDAFKILDRLDIRQKLCLPAHDQCAASLAAGPGGEACLDNSASQFIELGALAPHLLFDLCLGIA